MTVWQLLWTLLRYAVRGRGQEPVYVVTEDLPDAVQTELDDRNLAIVELYAPRLRCGHCGPRMQGSRNNGRVYYKCAGPRNTAGKRIRPDHPGTLYIREDSLLPAVADLIAARVFGPDRQAHLAAQHHAEPRQKAEQHVRAIEAAGRALDEITTRQANLMAELETTDPTTEATYRAGIRRRYAELEDQRVQAAARHAELIATQPVTNHYTPELLDAMPQAAVHLARVPVPVQRRLFEALHLTIRIDNARRAHVRITLTTDTPGTTNGVVASIHSDAGDDPATPQLPSGGTMPSDLEILATNRGDVLLTPMPVCRVQKHFGDFDSTLRLARRHGPLRFRLADAAQVLARTRSACRRKSSL